MIQVNVLQETSGLNNIPQIPHLNNSAMEQARHKQATLIKPKGALGKLETLSIRLSGIAGRMDWFPSKRATFVFAGDHGIFINREPSSIITADRIRDVLDEKGAVNSLSRQMGARLIMVDAGVNHRFKPRPRTLIPPIGQEMRKPTFVQRKIALGTNDFTQATAMTSEQANKAIQLGMDVVKEEQKRGLNLVFLGDITVGYTLSARAIITALTGHALGTEDVTDDLIQQALTYHQPANETTLMKVGSYEIGAIAGAILYASSQRIPIVLDGLTCMAGALIAHQLNPDIKQYLIAGHKSIEQGHQVALDYLGLDPLLDLEMGLGDGSGALLAYPLIEAAMRILNEMGTSDVG